MERAPKPAVYIFGWPSFVGGADTKLAHLIPLLSKDVDLTVIPNDKAHLFVVVGFDQITVTIAQFEIGIGQNACDAELAQGWAERPNHYWLGRASADNKPTNQNSVAGPDLPSRRYIAKAATRFAQIINFEERDSRSARLLRVGK